MERATQVDIAQIAGVSKATLLYVLTGRTNGRVTISPETKHHLLEAMAKLGYAIVAQALALRSGSTGTISFFIPDIHNPHFWQKFVWQKYVEEIDPAAQRGLGNGLLTSMPRLIRSKNKRTGPVPISNDAQRTIFRVRNSYVPDRCISRF